MVWGGTTAKAANISLLATKVVQAIKNGKWEVNIYANQAIMQQLGSKVVRGVINGNEKNKKFI